MLLSPVEAAFEVQREVSQWVMQSEPRMLQSANQ